MYYLDNKQKQPIKSFVWVAGLIQRVHRTRNDRLRCHKQEFVGGEGTRKYQKQNK